MNNQIPLKQDKTSDGSTLLLHSLFLTIQGEGPFAGERAVFIRLGGCNLQCPGCDTEYTEGARMVDIGTIKREVGKFAGQGHLVVITGGEPFRQPIGRLVVLLLDSGFRVQIETNGTLAPDSKFIGATIFRHLTIVCSPKGSTVHPKLLPFIGAFKYVASMNDIDERDGLPVEALGLFNAKTLFRKPAGHPAKVYIQPMDEKDDVKNQKNLQACVRSVFRFGYTLCLQVHKIIEVE